ncbi:BON domain-containing protein [Polaromonas sp. UC242_47]|uniref:BON domain-containing protein n=1 Tax=Polaromonas sp. UC242_47 TaxID=3374626 RepID=UPI0037BD3B4D
MNSHLTPSSRTALTVACSMALLLALSACNKQDSGKSVGESIDLGMAKTEQAAKAAKDKAAASMDSAGNAMKNATKEAEAAGSKAAGAMAEKIDDIAITTSVSTGLAKDPDLSLTKINVDTKDGVVTLNGPAPTAAAKDRATDIAKQVKGVTSVNNQLVIKAS